METMECSSVDVKFDEPVTNSCKNILQNKNKISVVCVCGVRVCACVCVCLFFIGGGVVLFG